MQNSCFPGFGWLFETEQFARFTRLSALFSVLPPRRRPLGDRLPRSTPIYIHPLPSAAIAAKPHAGVSEMCIEMLAASAGQSPAAALSVLAGLSHAALRADYCSRAGLSARPRAILHRGSLRLALRAASCSDVRVCCICSLSL